MPCAVFFIVVPTKTDKRMRRKDESVRSDFPTIYSDVTFVGGACDVTGLVAVWQIRNRGAHRLAVAR